MELLRLFLRAAAGVAGVACASPSLLHGDPSPKPIHHYVFFSQDRERIPGDSLFFATKALEGAQVTYTWRQLEPAKGDYDFSLIREDLALMSAHGKKLWVQIQDVTFDGTRTNVPRYLLTDPAYNGGVAQKFNDRVDETIAGPAGSVARRWDPAVQERLHKLVFALGKEFDGRIEGVNFDETSVGFGDSGTHWPTGFSPAIYRDAIITNMKVLKQAFPKSVAMQYANFVPGQWLAGGKENLRMVYAAAKESRVGMGGPDLLPFRPGQLASSYPLLREIAGQVPTGIAVQDGNFADINPTTRKPVTTAELLQFARDFLRVDYIFWGTQDPYYTTQVIPYLRASASDSPAVSLVTPAAIIAVNNARLTALRDGDVAALDQIFADEFMYIDQRDVESKDLFLNSVRRGYRLKAAKPDSVSVRLFGEAAVLVYRVRTVVGDAPLEVWSTCVYIFRQKRWQLVSQQTTRRSNLEEPLPPRSKN